MPPFFSERPRAVVIGYGFAGRSFHSYLIGLEPRLQLYGVCSRDPATRAKIVAERHCKTFDSFEAVLADPAVDLVVVATPHDTHAPLAIAAMKAGKHVVVDKVMCLNRAQCDQMIEASRATGKFLTVFHNRRLDDDFFTLAKVLEAGTLGDARWMEMSWQKFGRWRGWRATREAGGGRLMDLGAHVLDQVLLLNPSPVKSVYCRMHQDLADIEVETHVMVTIAFEDGKTATVDVGSMNRAPKPRMLVIGSEGTFVKQGVDPQEAAMIAGKIDEAKEDPANAARIVTDTGAQIVPTIPGRWREFYENVASVLIDGAPPLVKLDEMQRLMSVLDMAFESVKTGQVVAWTSRSPRS
jgi:scyllo-inositol 2-dehydrogenase (NADP+)